MPARPVDQFSTKHAYLQVADDVERRIGEGEFTIKLPAERALAEEYETAYTTVRRAMEELRDRGVITTIHGRGTFIAAALPAAPSAAPTAPTAPSAAAPSAPSAPTATVPTATPAAPTTAAPEDDN